MTVIVRTQKNNNFVFYPFGPGRIIELGNRLSVGGNILFGIGAVDFSTSSSVSEKNKDVLNFENLQKADIILMKIFVLIMVILILMVIMLD